MRTHQLLVAAFALGAIVACSSSNETASITPDDTDSGSSSTSGSTSSSGSNGGPTDAATDSPSDAADAADANKAFALTSTAFTEGSAIPLAQAQSCNAGGKQINGMDQSPPLAWTAGPATTMSYALELHDATNNLIHAVFYDIPLTVIALPGNLATNTYTPDPPGGTTKQAKNINNTFGYAGPCPPNKHTYEFILYAVDVATLPNANANTTKEDIVTALGTHMVATTKLTGTFTP